jgi:hypothetical protein
MSAETKQVLEMLKEGKITTEDAEKLLDKLSGSPSAPSGSTSNASAPGGQSAADSPVGPPKRRFLRIQVERPGRDHVNMRVPLSLARAGSWMTLIPPRVSERLAEQGIDLSGFAGLKDEQLAEALENVNIDIDKGNGKKVRIFCE